MLHYQEGKLPQEIFAFAEGKLLARKEGAQNLGACGPSGRNPASKTGAAGQ
ncbi:MAG: hypothetical protein HZT43_20650 [Exiguobacterium profundum]|nr:MAG: hypothetical protein HZT43_20650 [Exiguobacterium profundum]